MSFVVSIELTRKDRPARAELSLCDVAGRHSIALGQWLAEQDPEIRALVQMNAATLHVGYHPDSNFGAIAMRVCGHAIPVATFKYRVAIGGA